MKRWTGGSITPSPLTLKARSIEIYRRLRMKKETMTLKNTRKQIKDKATAGVDIVKKETGEVVGKVKRAASAANRKGKAAVRAIRS